MILATLLLAAATAAQPAPPVLTADQIKQAQTIVTDVCNACHEGRKAVSVKMLREKSPAKLTGHFRKKAELTDDQIKLMLQYLTAVCNGQAQLPAPAAVTGKITGSAQEGSKPHQKRRHQKDADEEQD